MTHAHRFLVPIGVVSLALLPACFGTGVAPATRTALAVSDDVLVKPGVTVDLQVSNVGNKNVVAKNVRLHLAAKDARATELRVDYDAACDALAPGATCVVHLTASAEAAQNAYPCVGEVRGDNTPSYPLELIDRLDPSLYPEGDRPDDGPGAAVTLTDVRLAPPAPALASLNLRNASRFGVTVQSLRLDPNSHVTLDTSSCPGYPHLAANSNCAVRVRAPTDAVPGTYVVQVGYEGGHVRGNARGQLVVVAGELVVNGGVPVTLDGNTTVLSVPVHNAGFDLAEVAVSLPWTDTCRGQLSLNIDASACTSGLAANTDCTVSLSTLGATPGASSQLIARADQASAKLQDTQPVRIGSLRVHKLHFSSPGNNTLMLENLGQTPISVRDVRVGGNRSGGLPAPGRSELAACQNFVGTCNVAVSATAEAWVEGGSSIIDVSYVASGILQRSTGELSVAPTSILFGTTQPIALHTGVQTVSVVLTNVGPFGWVSPGLTTVPALRGVSTGATTCGEVLPVNSTCTMEIVTEATTAYNAAAMLQPTGANAVAVNPPQVTVSAPVMLLGRATSGNTAIVTSLDAGASWAFAPEPATDISLLRGALSEAVWVAVGQSGDNQCIYVSEDRGHTWRPAPLDVAPGELRDVAAVSGGFIAVGGDDAGGFVRRSTDGIHWRAPQYFSSVRMLLTVSCAGASCVVTGLGYGPSNGAVLYSVDGAVSWTAMRDQVVPPDFLGQFLQPAQRGNVVALAGFATNKLALYSSAAGPGGPYVADAANNGLDGTFWSVAAGPNGWLAVGNDSTSQLVSSCQSASADAFATPPTALSPGTLTDAAWVGGGWTAVGQSDLSQGVMQRSVDGVTWQPSLVSGTTSLLSICVGQ